MGQASNSANAAARSGIRTTELWGKVVVQVVLLANALFGLGIEIDDQMAMGLVGLMESAYAISRSISKRASGASTDELVAAVLVAIQSQQPKQEPPQP